jgi:hypothetical protein
VWGKIRIKNKGNVVEMPVYVSHYPRICGRVKVTVDRVMSPRFRSKGLEIFTNLSDLVNASGTYHGLHGPSLIVKN